VESLGDGESLSILTVFEGENSYPSLEAALKDLKAGIKAYLDENGI
jgi:hypothetical protein